MKKKVLSALLVMAMLSTMGCGGTEESKNDGENSESTVAEESGAEDTADTASTDSDEQVTITYMQWQQEFSTAAITLADAYMEEHPNVKVEVITNSDGYSENLKAAITAGNVPEIFCTEGYENMKSYEEYIMDLSDQEWTKNIKDSAKDCVTLDGKIMGMPITMAGEGIIYNKKMFEEHGWEVPTTITELKDLCKEIQDAGITPFNNQFADDWLLGQYMSASGYAYIPDNAEYTADMYAGKNKLQDNEQMKNSFDILDMMLEYGEDDCMSYGWNETCTAFATGEAAMAFEGDWVWDTVSAIDPEIECGMFALPATDNPEDTKMIVDANGCFNVGKDSKHPKEALDYLNWIATSDTAKKIMLEDYKVIPVFEGWEYQADNQLAESTIEYIDNNMTYGWSWPKWPAGYQYSAGKTYQKYIGGEVDKDGALKELDETWSKLISADAEE